MLIILFRVNNHLEGLGEQFRAEELEMQREVKGVHIRCILGTVLGKQVQLPTSCVVTPSLGLSKPPCRCCKEILVPGAGTGVMPQRACARRSRES